MSARSAFAIGLVLLASSADKGIFDLGCEEERRELLPIGIAVGDYG